MRRISLRFFDPKLASEFENLDVNKNGYLEYSEIERAVQLLLKEKRRVRSLVLSVGALLMFVVMFLAAMVGLTYLVVNIQKVLKCSLSRMFAKSCEIGISGRGGG